MTPGHGSKLPRKREAAIAALLTHPTLEQAAAAAGVGKKTLWRWLRDSGFADAYRAARQESMSRAIACLQAAGGEAVATLRAVMADTGPLTPASARVSAARTILEMSLRVTELEDIESRLERMEYLATGLLNAQRQRHGGQYGHANQTYEER